MYFLAFQGTAQRGVCMNKACQPPSSRFIVQSTSGFRSKLSPQKGVGLSIGRIEPEWTAATTRRWPPTGSRPRRSRESSIIGDSVINGTGASGLISPSTSPYQRLSAALQSSTRDDSDGSSTPGTGQVPEADPQPIRSSPPSGSKETTRRQRNDSSAIHHRGVSGVRGLPQHRRVFLSSAPQGQRWRRSLDVAREASLKQIVRAHRVAPGASSLHLRDH